MAEPKYKIADEIKDLWHLGYLHEEAVNQETQERMRKFQLWAESGRDPDLGMKLGLISDPNEEAKLKQELLAAEKELLLLSQPELTQSKKFAMEKAVETVLGRTNFDAQLKKSIASALGDLGEVRMKTITSFADHHKDMVTDNAEFIGTLHDGLAQWDKGEQQKWIQANDGRQPNYLDSPVTKNKVKERTDRLASTLAHNIRNAPGWEPTADGSFDLSKIPEGDKKQLASLIALDKSIQGATGDEAGLVHFLKGIGTKPGLAENVEKILALEDKLLSIEQVQEQEDLSDEIKRKMPGVPGSEGLTNDIISTYESLFATINQAQDNTQKDGVENAINNIRLDSARRFGLRSSQLKRKMREHEYFKRVGDKIGVDASTKAGREQIYKFISQGGYKYIRQQTKSRARKGLRDLRKGDINLTDFYTGKVTLNKEPTAPPVEPVYTPPDSLPPVDAVDPTAGPVIEPGTTVEPPVDAAASPVDAAEEIYTQDELQDMLSGGTKPVDLLSDDAEEFTGVYDIEAQRKRAAQDRVTDLINQYSDNEFEPLLEEVTADRDMKVVDEERPLSDAMSGVPTLWENQGRTPERRPSEIQSHQATQSILNRPRQEQRRQAILGAANQLPKSIPAESAGTPTSPTGISNEEAYRNALEMAKAHMSMGSPMDPRRAAQIIAAEKLKQLQDEQR